MNIEILVNVTPSETRVARIENGVAEDLFIEREKERGIRGNIYKGRVQRVIPGIQAAFVDIGLDRSGFLYAGDIAQIFHQEDMDEGEEATPFHRKQSLPISELVEEGQEILVQVSKDPIASKGPRLTSNISLAGRYLVFLPNIDQIAVARRIDSEEERARLLGMAEAVKPDAGGLIVRTVAEDKHLFDLQADVRFLSKLWEDIDARQKKSRGGNLVHKELPLFLRVLRDYVGEDVEKVVVDSNEAFQQMRQFTKRFMNDTHKRISYYPGGRPLFSLHGVEDEISRALQRNVRLKSGGSIVLERTEALTAIDVNSGSFTSSDNLEETSLKTNLEAAHEIVHQLRIRNIGGIIVVDFIDMQNEENRTRLMEVLQETLKKDKAKTYVVQLSPLGLVEMTRKRSHESLSQIMTDSCHRCAGSGRVKSLRTICYELFREVVAEARAYPCTSLKIVVNPPLLEMLLEEESANIELLESFLGKTISIQSDASLASENYEIMLV